MTSDDIIRMEREACARLVEEEGEALMRQGRLQARAVANRLAYAIRARATSSPQTCCAGIPLPARRHGGDVFDFALYIAPGEVWAPPGSTNAKDAK